jgi:hypothetical protein
LFSSQKYHIHVKKFVNFCGSCLSYFCSKCALKSQCLPGHHILYFEEAHSEEEKKTPNFLIEESAKKVDILKSSLAEIDNLLQKTELRCKNLISSVDKFFSQFSKKFFLKSKNHSSKN